MVTGLEQDKGILLISQNQQSVDADKRAELHRNTAHPINTAVRK